MATRLAIPAAAAAILAACAPAHPVADVTEESQALWDRVSRIVAPGVLQLADGSCLDGRQAPEGWTLQLVDGALRLETTQEHLGLAADVAQGETAAVTALATTPGFWISGWSAEMDRFSSAWLIARPQRIDEITTEAADPPASGALWLAVNAPWSAADRPDLLAYTGSDSRDNYVVSRDRRTQCKMITGIVSGETFLECWVVAETDDAKAKIQLPRRAIADLPEVLAWATLLLSEIRTDCPDIPTGRST
jgi:hypothetical protein